MCRNKTAKMLVVRYIFTVLNISFRVMFPFKKRKREEEERETTENDDEVAVDENNDEETETDDTSSLGSCQDCGFPVYWSKYEDHQYCKGNSWACRFCENVATTLTDAKLHVWNDHSYLLRK